MKGEAIMPEVIEKVIEKEVVQATAHEQVLIQPESVSGLKAENAKLRIRTAELESRALRAEQEQNEALNAQLQEKRHSIIETTVYNLETAGYITAAQVNAGLAQALATIPDGAKIVVAGKERLAFDIIIECLKHGGMLKLKGEVAPMKLDAAPSHTPDLDRLEASGRHISGVDVARKARELREKDPKLSLEEALRLANEESQN
jgi:hypothetical protein